MSTSCQGPCRLENGECVDCGAVPDFEDYTPPLLGTPVTPAPIDMLLWCPHCHEQHIDGTNQRQNWLNPPHRTHLCHKCGHLWRPALVSTNGVKALRTETEGGAGG